MGELSTAGLTAEVQCFLPGNSQCVARALLSPGEHCLSKIGEALKVPVPLVDLLPMNEEPTETEQRSDNKVILKAGQRYKAVLGAARLIRFNVENKQSRPYLCEEGLWLLKNLCTPVYVAVFIGLGRCGKSTTCSALSRATEGQARINGAGPECFPSSDKFDPVTIGADVAALPSNKWYDNGCLLIIDCEGSDNAFTKDLQNCRTLATFAFAFASHIIFCEEGGRIKETSIDELGAAVATAGLIQASKEMRFLPKICYLMLKCNLTLSKEDIDKVFGDQEDASRNGSRRDIRAITHGELDVRNLVNFENTGNQARYEEGIRGLHNYLCQSSVTRADLNFTGAQLAEVLTYLCREVAALGTFEPESVYSSIIQGHLQMIMKACIDEYQKRLPVLEYYQDDSELKKRESFLRRDALEKFDHKAHRISSATKSDIRCETEKRLQDICDNKLLQTNTRYRESEESEAKQIRLAIADAFGCRIKHDWAHSRALSKHKLTTYEHWQSENLTEFEIKTSQLRCRAVVEAAKSDLKNDLTEHLQQLREHSELLRLKSQASCMSRILTILVILLLLMGVLALGIVPLRLGSQELVDVPGQCRPENATPAFPNSSLQPGVSNVTSKEVVSTTVAQTTASGELQQPLSTTAALTTTSLELQQRNTSVSQLPPEQPEAITNSSGKYSWATDIWNSFNWREWTKPEEAPTALLTGIAGMMCLALGVEFGM